MIFAGVDIAKVDHVVAAIDERGEAVAKPMPFKNSGTGFERCVAYLEGLALDNAGVFVGMEATGHYWMACFSFLVSRGFKVAVINPMQVKAVRKLKGYSRVKNDRIDSQAIAETMRIGDFDETRLATDELQSLKTLTRYQQSLKQEVATVKTQAICLMDAYFPEYAGMFTDMFGASSMAILSKCPTPAECNRTHAATLAKILPEASRGRFGTEKAANVKAAAKGSVGITLGSDAASFQIKELVSRIVFLNKKASEADRRISVLLQGIEPLILTIPGISTTTGAQIVAEIGDASRFPNAAAVVSYAGLNSAVSQSGRFEATGEPITKHGSPYLRRPRWLAANRARQYDPNLKAFYDKKRSEGKCHRVAVTAVARKLCHIVFAVMRDQIPYDPER